MQTHWYKLKAGVIVWPCSAAHLLMLVMYVALVRLAVALVALLVLPMAPELQHWSPSPGSRRWSCIDEHFSSITAFFGADQHCTACTATTCAQTIVVCRPEQHSAQTWAIRACPGSDATDERAFQDSAESTGCSSTGRVCSLKLPSPAQRWAKFSCCSARAWAK